MADLVAGVKWETKETKDWISHRGHREQPNSFPKWVLRLCGIFFLVFVGGGLGWGFLGGGLGFGGSGSGEEADVVD